MITSSLTQKDTMWQMSQCLSDAFLLERRHSSSSFGLIHVSAQLDEGDVVKAISRTLWAAAFTFPETGREQAFHADVEGQRS